MEDIKNLCTVSHITGRESANAYLPLHVKTIDNDSDGVFVVVPRSRTDLAGVSVVQEPWSARRSVFAKESKASSQARKHGCDVAPNKAVLLPDGPLLYSPLDTHEALVSAYVARALGDTPFFPAHIQDVQLTTNDDSLLKFVRLTNACEISELARMRETTAEPLKTEVALVALATLLAQQRLGLKHMDLHCENVMWQNAPAEATRLLVPDFFGAGRHLAIPLEKRGSIPAMIDFGLSTMRTHHAPSVQLLRADYHLLESYDNEEEWGRYSTTLNGDEGYDLTTFVESMTRDVSDLRPQPLGCLRTLQRAHSALGAPEITSEGRPRQKVAVTMRAFLETFCADWASECTQDSDMVVRIAAAHKVTLPPSPAESEDSEAYENTYGASEELR